MYIYCATSPSGKRYIGQTTRSDILVRWKEHQYDARTADRCKALNNAIRKYGAESFTVTRIVCCLPWFLDEYEALAIAEYDTAVPRGYNIKLGGSSGKHHAATKDKIRNSLKGRTFSEAVLKRRGNAKKREKSLPMFVAGWYRQGILVGVRVCNPKVKERRFALTKHGGLPGCILAAVQYMSSDGEGSTTKRQWVGSSPA